MRQLLIIQLDGHVYGIWEDEALSVEALPAVHHLPFSPAYVAGVSIRHDHTITLLDLSVCVGHAGMLTKAQGAMLIMSGSEKIAGFAFEAGVRRAEIGPDSIHPMPDYLKTPIIDSCVVMGSALVPVININALYHQVLTSDYQLFKPSLTLSRLSQDDARIEKIRLFEASGDHFAVSAEHIEGAVQIPEQITGLAQVPRFVIGIALYQGRVLTIIDLQQQISVKDTKGKGRMLVAELGQALFGLLVHTDKGDLGEEDFLVKPLPPIAQSRWLRSAIKHEGVVVPLLDLGALISVGEGGGVEKPLPEHYHSDPAFFTVFGKQDADVVEFLLLGQCHAIPKSEVKDVVGFKPYRQIPNVPEIVIGVAEDDGELLPVLDLAMVFGRRSLATPEWRMIKLSNGDFRALVITEVVHGDQKIALDIQRALPILLPHHVVYGCYPGGDSVRLILNVEALTVHFEKALVQKLLPALSEEMKQARAEIVSSLLEETAAPYPGSVVPQVPEERFIPQSPVEALPSIETEEVASAAEQPAVPEVIEAAPLPAKMEEVSQPEEIPAVPSEHEKPAPAEEESVHKEEPGAAESREMQGVSEPTAAQELISQEAEEGARGEAEEKAQQEAEERARSEAEEQAKREAEERARIEAETRMREEIEESARREAEEKALQEAEEQRKAEAAARAAEVERAYREAEEKAQQEAEERARREAEEQAAAEIRRKAEAEQKAQEEAAAVLREAEEIARQERERAITGTTAPSESLRHTPVEAASKPSALKKSFVSLAIIGLVAGAVFYLLLRKPSVEVKEPKAPVGTMQKRAEEPLVLTVPPGMKIEIDRYIVKKGDTLWDISKRFTGNPLNYPGIAGENKIPNPDLIYPEQKIIIKKKEK